MPWMAQVFVPPRREHDSDYMHRPTTTLDDQHHPMPCLPSAKRVLQLRRFFHRQPNVPRRRDLAKGDHEHAPEGDRSDHLQKDGKTTGCQEEANRVEGDEEIVDEETICAERGHDCDHDERETVDESESETICADERRPHRDHDEGETVDERETVRVDERKLDRNHEERETFCVQRGGVDRVDERVSVRVEESVHADA